MSYVRSLIRQNKGFTLVELAISIVIIGLLVAGVSSGTALIEQARLKTIFSEMQSYRVAYSTFRATYDAVPGDMINASSIFSGCASTASHCNGDGNGQISLCTEVPVGGLDDEMRVFRHLRLAGLINKGGNWIVSPTSCFPPTGGSFLDPNNGYPTSSVGNGKAYAIAGGINGFYGVASIGAHGSSLLNPWDASVNAVCLYGNPYPVTDSNERGAITAKQAFNLDRKFDDGFANGTAVTGFATGQIRTVDGLETGSTTCMTGGNYDINQSPAQVSCVPCYQLN